MARASRIDVGGEIYHILNRSNGRTTLFHTEQDYKDFEYLLSEMKETYGIRILAYVIMPNHWHLLLCPLKDKDLSKTMHWLTTSHVRRHHTRKRTVGYGHLYQGSYKSFLIKDERHLLTVLKYIERNPARAKLCKSAQAWEWGSASKRTKDHRLLANLPVNLPRHYQKWVNEPESAELLKVLRYSANKGVPYEGIVE